MKNLDRKGSAHSLEKPVGKRWEGSDVPASILEAGELFANRMRMSRSLRQLWEVREKYIRAERGWNAISDDDHDEDLNDEEGSNFAESDGGDQQEFITRERIEIKSSSEHQKMKHEKETDDEEVQRRLDAIKEYYVSQFP